jgi:hypothetical protein
MLKRGMTGAQHNRLGSSGPDLVGGWVWWPTTRGGCELLSPPPHTHTHPSKRGWVGVGGGGWLVVRPQLSVPSLWSIVREWPTNIYRYAWIVAVGLAPLTTTKAPANSPAIAASCKPVLQQSAPRRVWWQHTPTTAWDLTVIHRTCITRSPLLPTPV